MLFGLVLLGVEMITPVEFCFLFFGFAALIIGSLTGLGFAQAEWLQWLQFSVLSTLSLLLFRGPLLARIKTQEKNRPAVDSLAREGAILLEDLAVGATGKAVLHGTAWTAHNAGTIPLTKGQRCTVERIEGITLWISAE